MSSPVWDAVFAAAVVTKYDIHPGHEQTWNTWHISQPRLWSGNELLELLWYYAKGPFTCAKKMASKAILCSKALTPEQRFPEVFFVYLGSAQSHEEQHIISTSPDIWCAFGSLQGMRSKPRHARFPTPLSL